MAIYDKPTWQLMREMAQELLTGPDGIITKGQVHNWFQKRYPKIKRGTIDAHLSRMSTNLPVRAHYHPKPGNDDLFFRLDPQRFRRFNPQCDPAPTYENSPGDPLSEGEAESSQDAGSDGESGNEFAYESDLRDYLAKNLNQIEPGLRLYDDDGVTGIEFPVGGRFIDILAVDASSRLVVVELKVSRGYDRVIGQLLRYMGWIRQNLAEESQQVRGIIVAREINADLKLACAEVGRIELFEYKLSLRLQRVA